MVYENIKEISQEQNMSIRQVEIKSGLKNGAIGKWRSFSPKLASVQKVADALGVPITELLKQK